ncbi:MAG TPA: galactose-1-phosphate uridylyltransferase [Acidimicrobiia bacterium]|nr:galactose-1-phosphate uridylyltransferase [Acidimicrobiia bacterium]
MSAFDGELRFDGLTREWVNIVGQRQDRPNLPTSGCPFCVGGIEAPAAYDVHWFENRWPALAPGAPIDVTAAEATGTTTLPAIGAAEVVLFSPDHDQSLGTLDPTAIRRVVDLWAARTDALLARPEVEYVLVFENRGRDVGATIDHPHGQIYAYPFVPPVPRLEGAVARAHGCPVCDEVRREAADGRRVVAENRQWLAYVPFASQYSYGVRLAARTHLGRLADLDDPGRDAFAEILRDVLSRYDRLWRDAPNASPVFPYLMWIHQAPRSDADDHHLHVHFAPPQRAPGVARYVASGELGSGTFSNPVVPEVAAGALRDA